MICVFKRLLTKKKKKRPLTVMEGRLAGRTNRLEEVSWEMERLPR